MREKPETDVVLKFAEPENETLHVTLTAVISELEQDHIVIEGLPGPSREAYEKMVPLLVKIIQSAVMHENVLKRVEENDLMTRE